MEKLKDIIHDFTDIILAIIIALSMFLVVNWHLNAWLPNSTAVAANTPTNIEDELQEITEEETKDPEEEVKDDTQEQQPSPTDNDIIVVKNVTINIPTGSTGSAIANILKEKGLIEDTRAFITEAENLRLASKLQSGTFQIPENASLELMIKIIARQPIN